MKSDVVTLNCECTGKIVTAYTTFDLYEPIVQSSVSQGAPAIMKAGGHEYVGLFPTGTQRDGIDWRRSERTRGIGFGAGSFAFVSKVKPGVLVVEKGSGDKYTVGLNGYWALDGTFPKIDDALDPYNDRRAA